MAAADEDGWWAPPETPDGLVDYLQVAREVCHAVHCVGGYLDDAAQIMMEMQAEMPPNGPLANFFYDLAERMHEVTRVWTYADDALLTTAQILEAECRR